MSSDEQPTWLTEDVTSAGDRRPAPFQQVGLIDDTTAVDVTTVRPRGNRPRWLAPVTAAVVLVLTVSIVGVWALSNALTGSAADAARIGYSYLPANTTIAAELRLDLPAGQKEQLGTFLTRFPGFTDAGTVESRLVELLNDLVRSASQGKADYTGDVQPWFSGWVVGGMSVRAAMASGPGQPMVVFGVSDRDAAETAMLKLRSSTLNWTAADVDGVKIWSGAWSRDGTDLGFDFGGQAYAVTDEVLVYASSADDVKSALDARAGTAKSLLDNERFASALGRVPVARLGLAWVDISGSGATMMMAGPTMAMGGTACSGLTQGYPTDAVAALYLRDGRAAIDVSYAKPAGAPALPVRQSVLDVHVPADTFLFAETKAAALGVTNETLDCLRNMPGLEDQIAELERSLGSLDDLIGWIGDTAIAARFDGTKVTAGVVIKVSDELKASEALGQLRAALTLWGNQSGGVTVSEETYRDARLVSFDFAGARLTSLPSLAPSPSLAYAMKGGVLVIGIDASFARAVLDTAPSTSLAGNAGYRRALEFAGATSNAGAMYVDVPAALRLYDALATSLPGATNHLAGMREYLDPLDDASVVLLGDDRTTTVRITLNTRDLP